jgi:WD40 repeat protein
MKRKLWLARAGVCVSMLLASASWSLDLGGLFGSGGDSGSGKVATLEFRLKDGSFTPTSVAWSPDGKYIATSGTQTRLIHIWDVEKRKLVKELELPNPPAVLFHNMTWSPDGKYLATCNSLDSSLRIFNTNDWSVAKDLDRQDAGACQKPAFSSDGEEMTVWGHDLTTFAVNGWRVIQRLKGTTVLKDGKFLKPQDDGWDRNMRIRDMTYVPGTHSLAFGGGQYEKDTQACGPVHEPLEPYAGRVWLLDPGEKTLQRSVVVYCPPRGGDVQFLAFRPDGHQFVTSTGTGNSGTNESREVSIRIMNWPDGRVLGAPLDRITDSQPRGLAYTPDGRNLLVGQSGKGVSALYIIDETTMQVLDAVHAQFAILDVAASPTESLFAAASGDGITVWKFIRH